jgi:hypothetical protein
MAEFIQIIIGITTIPFCVDQVSIMVLIGIHHITLTTITLLTTAIIIHHII